MTINQHGFESNHQSDSFYNNQNIFNTKRVYRLLSHERYRIYVIIGLSLTLLLVLSSVILCCLCRRKKHIKHPSPAERKLLPNGEANKTINHYHKSIPQTSATPPVSLSASSTAIQKLINSTRQKGI